MFSFKTAVKNIRQFSRRRIPGQVVIQTTSHCIAHCPQCGMHRSAAIERASSSDGTIKKVLEGCAPTDIQAISFSGGDPLFMLCALTTWIDYAADLGIPFIPTGTNGFLFCGSEHSGFSDRIKRLADRLAATALRNLWIRLDSFLPDVMKICAGCDAGCYLRPITKYPR